MRQVVSLVVLLVAFGLSAVASEVLGTVRINESVLAGGKPLPAGKYEVRVTDERLAPLPGQSADAQRWVEFVAADGTVVAREIAEVMTSDDAPVGTSSASGSSAVKVEKLKGAEFLRISARRGGERYLVHLPLAP